MIELSKYEAIRLYVLLSEHSERLDGALCSLLSRLEHYLYEKLSIEDIERLQKGGLKNVEVVEKKL